MKNIILSIAVLGLAACQQPGDDGQPGNDAVDTTPTQDAGASDGANSFTEDQARGAIEGAGYTEVTGLTKDAQGVWRGTAKQGATSKPVAVDFRGSVTSGEAAAGAMGSGAAGASGQTAPTQP